MYIVKKEGNQTLSLPASEIDFKNLKHFNSELVIRIIDALRGKELYPKQIAQILGEHEQKIYYHIRNLEQSGIVVQTKSERIKGSFARYYKLVHKGFFFRFGEFEISPKLLKQKSEKFLKPFISNGQLDAVIITGSPDPHGPDKARSRDGYYGIDLGLFFGTFLSYVPKLNVRLDTEVKDKELERNLILIGGPVVNKVTERVNKGLPIFFKRGETLTIKSKITGNSYPGDEMGLIVKAQNPFNKGAMILLVAGKRHSGTRAAIVGILKHFSEITKGNKHKKSVLAKVVEGLDLDSDGIVDEVEFKE